MNPMSFCKCNLPCLAVIPLLFLTQCADDPAEDAAVAEVVDDAEAEAAAMELANSLDFGLGDQSAEEMAAAEAEVAESRVFVFGENSKIGFIGSKLTAIHEGSFKNFSGHFTVAGDGIDNDGTHRISIDMASVVTDDEKLTAHLKSEDFFDVAKFPVTTFSLLSMDGADTGAYQIVGILDLHGVKKKITFPAQIDVAEDRNSLKMRAKFSLDRKAFGIVYPGVPDDLIRDRVVIDLDLEAHPGDPAPLNLTASEEKSQPIVLSAPDNAGDPGTPTAGGAPGEGGGRRAGGGGGGRGGTPAETIARMDGNGDGKLTEDEVPEFVWSRMSAADENGDGSIDEDELTKARAARDAEGGGGGPRGGGRPRGGGGGDGPGGGGGGGDTSGSDR